MWNHSCRHFPDIFDDVTKSDFQNLLQEFSFDNIQQLYEFGDN